MLISKGMCPWMAIFLSLLITGNEDMKDCASWHCLVWWACTIYNQHGLIFLKKCHKASCKVTQNAKYKLIDNKNLTSSALWTKVIHKVKITELNG